MSKLRCHISISLDGFVAGPDQSEENPLGVGGERLHDWVVPLDASMLSRRVRELPVEVAGEVSLEGSHGLALGLSFVGSAGDVGAARGVVDGA